MNNLEVYFDFLSPFSYFAWQWVYENRHKYKFLLIPVPMGQVIKAYDTKGPAEIAPKARFLYKQCLRYAQRHTIPFVCPHQLPFNSLFPLRMLAAILHLPEWPVEKRNALAMEFSQHIFGHYWAAGGESLDFAGCAKMLDFNIDKNDQDDVLSFAESRATSLILKSNVKQALVHGVFGVPSFLLGQELFWGNDSIIDLELFLQGKDVYNQNDYNKFLGMRVKLESGANVLS